jgi:peptidyl-prolyl cis-trans isomerase SurA
MLAHGVRAEQLVDGVAAQVGSEIVLISDVLEAAAPAAARAQAQGATDEQIRQLHAAVLEEMIERALIRQVVKRAEIGATDAEVDQAIAGIAKENGLTPEKLQQAVEAQGMPYAIYRERIRGEIEHAKVLNDVVAAHVRVSEEEVRALYDKEIAKQPKGGDEFDLRLIVITAKGNQPDAHAIACEQTAAARRRVADGESFGAVASQVSEANPEQGGAQGWVHESQLADWMRPTVMSLQPGGLSDVIETGFGCGVVLVEDRRSFVPASYEKAKPQLEKLLSEQQMAAEYQKFIEKLRAQTYIERKGVFGETGSSTAASSLGEGF